ncbi:hypothetical protein CCM_00566 [Cordyceps militaris CM01]|uniref:Uncharacterized protein n=1 Tax=Cordyceps militaris (strain CM01) TaxID=983644 RepID=G3J4U5_CORMM|nr:uncharacterized protein CCM_00566 [Cordyceps militaris CM01]EGX95912.1 hypothetical protein CCM_00566 [Cordyceps militaris CM01]
MAIMYWLHGLQYFTWCGKQEETSPGREENKEPYQYALAPVVQDRCPSAVAKLPNNTDTRQILLCGWLAWLEAGPLLQHTPPPCSLSPLDRPHFDQKASRAGLISIAEQSPRPEHRPRRPVSTHPAFGSRRQAPERNHEAVRPSPTARAHLLSFI